MTQKLPMHPSMIEEVPTKFSDRPKQLDFSFSNERNNHENKVQETVLPIKESNSPHGLSLNGSDLSQSSFGYIDLGYRPYFVYRLQTTEVIMVNDERHDFCFLAYKNFKLNYVA